MWRFAWVFLLAPACGATPTAAADSGNAPFSDGGVSSSKGPWQSGTRLRARVLDGGGGGKLFLGWQDTTEKFACGFHPGTDGKLRCLPDEALTPYFEDSQCTKPLGADVFTVPFVRAQTQIRNQCPADDPPMGVMSVGEKISVPSSYHRDQDGKCIEFKFAMDQVWRRLVPVDLTRFVSVTRREAPAEGSLSPVVFDSEDGAVEVAGFLDGPRKVPCALASYLLSRPLPQPEPPSVCVSTRVSVIPVEAALYADAMYTHQLIKGFMGCPTSDLVVMWSHDNCDPLLTLAGVVAIGNAHASTPTPEQYYSQMGGPMQADMSTTIYDATPTSLAALPVLSLRDVGTGRLKARFGATAAGIVARNPDTAEAGTFPFFDSLEKMICLPALTVDGEQRCVPRGTVRLESTVFADAACSQPALLVTPTATCTPKVPHHVAILAPVASGSTAPRPIQAVYATVGPPAKGDIYVLSEKGGGCVREYQNSGFLAAPLGPRLNPGDLPRLTETTE